MQWFQENVNLGELLTQGIAWLPQLGAAIVIFAAFAIGSRVIRRPLGATLRKTGLHATLVQLLVDKILHYVVLVFGLIMALDQLGVNVAAALAGLGVAGIAVGFAAQDTLSNIIAGIVIFMDKPFLVEDWVTTSDQYGQVTNITLRTTRIRTNRNTFVVIPNAQIINSVLENHSKQGALRVDAPVGIAYKEDIDQARAVMLEAVKDLAHQSKDRAADVVVGGLGASSVDLTVRVWIDDGKHQQATFFAMNEACKKALDAAGIEIPFPHMQLFVEDVRDAAVENLAKLSNAGKG